jgi:hypothetical protein
MIRFSMDRSSVYGFRSRLRDFVKEAGKTESEAVQLLAKACAKELAITVLPFGLSSSVGKKFTDSVGKQVDYAWAGSKRDVFQSSSMQAAHQSARNSQGVVRMRKFGGRPVTNESISVAQKEIYKRKVIAKVGMAKGAWIAAAERLNGKKITGVGAWVRRHAKNNGTSNIRIERAGTTVLLTNSISYIKKIHQQDYIDRALKRGYMRNWKHMTIVVKKLRGEI